MLPETAKCVVDGASAGVAIRSSKTHVGGSAGRVNSTA